MDTRFLKPAASDFKNIFLIFTTFLLVHTVQAQDTTCFDKAKALYEAENYPDAYKSFSDCVKNTEDKKSDTYKNSLLYMGICAMENVDYKQASSLLHMAERILDSSSENYIRCRQELAALSKRQGNYNDAEKILLNLLDMQEASPNADCALKGITLNDIGVIYKRLGQYDRSIQYLSESLELKYSCLDPEDPSIMISLNNLAGVYMKQKAYKRADSLYNASIKIKTKRFGANHPSTLIARHNLAELYRQQGNYDDALAILQDVLARKDSTIGKNTLSYAATLHTIANVYFSSGKYSESFQYCHRSISIKEQLIGKTAVSTMHSYILLAKNQHALGKNKDAQSLYNFILKTKLDEIDTYFTYLGEEEKIQYLKASNTYWKEFTAFVLDMNADSTKNISTKNKLFNQWIENRWYLSELILEETQRQHRLWENISDSTQLKRVEELKELKDIIAKTSLLKSKEDTHTELNELINRSAQLEKELTSIYAIDKRKKYTVADITHTLHASECIVEIIKPLLPSGKYLALIYLKGIKTPYKIELSESALLDGKAYAYYKNAIQFKMDDKKSFELYWKPIDDFISMHTEIRKIYLVRDGIYTCMNIHTLLSDTPENYTSVIYLNKTENILSYKNRSDVIPLSKTAFIYHPVYGYKATDCSYADLPGTKTEVDSIDLLFRKQKLNTIRYGEAMATEAAIKNDTNAYSVIHIATHGYLEINPEDDYVESMIHSGLLLSGACDPFGIDSITADDGILTAYEIAQLNLSATDLVVLSACQSGLGTIDAQEGLIGLQRGLLVAGTKKVLVSLWKIDDSVTAEWMLYFYSSLIETRSCTEAYVFAQKKIRAQYVHPYYWGAFVLLEQ